MQLFYLFSFVAVVSHAAALPQPAGLSEQYSNSADITLVSGLEARSYQPELNSHKDSATLVSLKRRDGSGGDSGESSEGNPILHLIYTLVGAAKFDEIFQAFLTALRESRQLIDKKEREVTGAVSNILTKTGTVIENVNTIDTSFKDIFNSRIKLFTLLGSPLKDFESTKILYGYICYVVTSLGKFLTDQQKIHDNIIKALEPPPSK
ncbi:hypothetical protein BASA50_010081 [Batrachochytrium salamandrivorans]|uniref:Uncharacterized protein n=1 Tax=Batrachochytrium salamandrivorans TaxID=1357716 RepID=A0ABQ8EZJ8_9FUNG|nr:hypothetical protein BASA50_010081 [Batrachochytrium salamandrivorans]